MQGLHSPWKSLHFKIKILGLENPWKLQLLLESSWISVLTLAIPDSQVPTRSKHRKTFRIKYYWSCCGRTKKRHNTQGSFCIEWSPWKIWEMCCWKVLKCFVQKRIRTSNIEFLWLFLKHLLTVKSEAASQNVYCFLRLVLVLLVFQATFTVVMFYFDFFFQRYKNVILIFSVKESGKFQGFARLASEAKHGGPTMPWVLPPGMSAKALGGVFKLEWLNRYHWNLRNSYMLIDSDLLFIIEWMQ